MNVAVLVPVKELAAAKQRLAPALEPSERERLARWVAERVIAACTPLPVFVACEDADVAAWAAGLGATPLVVESNGLNAAVDAGVAALAASGFDHVTVAHSDLPLASSLGAVARANTITLVPDQRRDGTNVMSFPTASEMRAAYGIGSFQRHLCAAQILAETHSLNVEVRVDADLGIDLDHVEDLDHPRLRKVLPTWLQTTPDNPPS